jgi:hypothetical protein
MPEPKARYPMNAPAATASITKPLYVMNSNLDGSVSLREVDLENTCLHDKEAVENLHGVQDGLNEQSLSFSRMFAVSPYSE